MKKVSDYPALLDFQKNNEGDKIYWTGEPDKIGDFLFSFDCDTVYNFFSDYPHNLTKEQKEIFDEENPTLADLKR